MHVLVTGASGWVGRGLVPELITAGHTVTGLARTDAAAAALKAAEVDVLRGSLDDVDVLREAAAAADGVVHLAFKHDLAFIGDFAGATAADRVAIEAFGDALAGTGKPLVIASGILAVLGLAPGVVATERDGRAPTVGPTGAPVAGGEGRMDNADRALALAAHGVRSSVVRLPPATHGVGDNGFIPKAIGLARQHGTAAYVGDGNNRWPAVHRDDAARLFRLALESAPAGSVLHAVGDGGVPIRQVAELIAAGLDLPAVSVGPDRIGAYLGFLGAFWSFDGPATAELTEDLLGWRPTGPGLLHDLRVGHYFA